MTEEAVTVYHNRLGLSVRKVVAEALELKSGQTIDARTCDLAVYLNCSLAISEIETELARREGEQP